MRFVKRLSLLVLCLGMTGCILWEGEWMEVDGRYEKVYQDWSGRKYYSYKGRKKYLRESQRHQSMDDKSRRLTQEAEQYDSEY